MTMIAPVASAKRLPLEKEEWALPMEKPVVVVEI